MSKEFDSINRKIEIKGFPKLIKKQIGRMVQKDRIEEAEQIQRDYINRKLDKKFDLYRVEIKQSSRSKRKEVRRKKAVDREEGEKIWKDNKNRPDHIRKRIDDYLKVTLGILEKKLSSEELEKLKDIIPEEANREIQVYYGVYEDVKTNVKIQMKKMYEVPLGSHEREIASIEFLKLMYYLSRAFPEEMMGLFEIDGIGKTNFEKCRKEVISQKKS